MIRPALLHGKGRRPQQRRPAFASQAGLIVHHRALRGLLEVFAVAPEGTLYLPCRGVRRRPLRLLLLSAAEARRGIGGAAAAADAAAAQLLGEEPATHLPAVAVQGAHGVRQRVQQGLGLLCEQHAASMRIQDELPVGLRDAMDLRQCLHLLLHRLGNPAEQHHGSEDKGLRLQDDVRLLRGVHVIVLAKVRGDLPLRLRVRFDEGANDVDRAQLLLEVLSDLHLLEPLAPAGRHRHERSHAARQAAVLLPAARPLPQVGVLHLHVLLQDFPVVQAHASLVLGHAHAVEQDRRLPAACHEAIRVHLCPVAGTHGLEEDLAHNLELVSANHLQLENARDLLELVLEPVGERIGASLPVQGLLVMLEIPPQRIDVRRRQRLAQSLQTALGNLRHPAAHPAEGARTAPAVRVVHGAAQALHGILHRPLSPGAHRPDAAGHELVHRRLHVPLRAARHLLDEHLPALGRVGDAQEFAQPRSRGRVDEERQRSHAGDEE
mmetsp:Transcript_28634/g.72440  ORF Transcript_28634/g.72440 Transcript_28634/m.72440 type:complete len:493 (+) Transcript_28634:341-1819(+)